MRDTNGVDADGRREGERLGGVGQETAIGIYFVRKKNPFQYKEKKLKSSKLVSFKVDEEERSRTRF